MIEQLKGKYEFKHYLAPDTEEKVIIIGACLIGERNQVNVKCSAIMRPESEIMNFLSVMKWLCINRELYHVSGNDNVIVFINGSTIVFEEYEMPVRPAIIPTVTIPL